MSKALIVSLLFGYFLACRTGCAAEATWEKVFVDPHPAPGDLVLPMPCGGAMVFRPVDVPAGRGPLDDRLIDIGRTDTQEGYSEYQRQAWLAAPFAVPSVPETRRFYIGKYDVTRDQFAALTQPCKAPSAAGRLPAANISWIEAVDFASSWSSWLLGHARDTLPKRGRTYGFVRLPTDEEWSYAARGGTKVTETDFLAPTWPMPEGIDHYVMAGPDVAGGSAHAVGSMLPNPLGLYDVLGEVDQMMVEPFRLNRVGRSHGQAGGLLIRGGNYTYNPDDLHTSLRSEIPPFDPATNAPTRLATMGFRLVISADALGDLEDTQSAQSEFDALNGKERLVTGTTPRELLDRLKSSETNPGSRDALARIDAALAGEQRARDDQAALALGAELEAATALALNIWEGSNAIRLLKQMLTGPTGLTDAELAAPRHNLDNHVRLQAGSVEGYLELIRSIGASPAASHLDDQARLQANGMRDRGEVNLAAFIGLVENDAKQAVAGKSLDAVSIQSRIAAIPIDKARASAP